MKGKKVDDATIAKAVEESKVSEVNLDVIARKYGVIRSTLDKWRRAAGIKQSHQSLVASNKPKIIAEAMAQIGPPRAPGNQAVFDSVAKKWGVYVGTVSKWVYETLQEQRKKSAPTKTPKKAAAAKHAVAAAAPVTRGYIPIAIRDAMVTQVLDGGDVTTIAAKYGVRPATVEKYVVERGNGEAAQKVGAQMARKKANGAFAPDDVMTYLRHGRDAVKALLKTGRIADYDDAHLLMLLALSAAEKARQKP